MQPRLVGVLFADNIGIILRFSHHNCFRELFQSVQISSKKPTRSYVASDAIKLQILKETVPGHRFLQRNAIRSLLSAPVRTNHVLVSRKNIVPVSNELPFVPSRQSSFHAFICSSVLFHQSGISRFTTSVASYFVVKIEVSSLPFSLE